MASWWDSATAGKVERSMGVEALARHSRWEDGWCLVSRHLNTTIHWEGVPSLGRDDKVMSPEIVVQLGLGKTGHNSRFLTQPCQRPNSEPTTH